MPNIVFGASYSGYVMMWDVRVKNTPIEKTCAAKNGHNHPIYSLTVVGSPNAHNIISVSNDGRLCMWSPGMFNEPKKYIDLRNNLYQDNDPLCNINAHCIAFAKGETNTFFLGSEDYNIYRSELHS